MKNQLKLIEETLNTLTQVRISENRWKDDEVESAEESCAYKNMEVLYPYFLANHIDPSDFSRISLPANILLHDVTHIISSIKTDGFNPSPYLYIREKIDFVDFAANSIQFFILARNYLRDAKEIAYKKKKTILKEAENIIKKAIRFLIENAERDKYGARWAGSIVRDYKGTSFCNIYYTSQALSALSFALDFHKKGLSLEEQEEIEQLIKEGCLWTVHQEKNGLIAGDEAKTKSEINFTFYGLNALFDCYTLLDQKMLSTTIKLFKAFVNHLKINKQDLAFLTYIDVPVEKFKKPIYIDDRSSIGNIILVLCKGREIFKEDKIIDDVFYLINYYVGQLLKLRDVKTNLWDSDNILLYLNNRAIEALLYSAKYGAIIEYKITEREAVIALQKTLSNPLIQRIFLDELTNVELMKKLKQEKE